VAGLGGAAPRARSGDDGARAAALRPPHDRRTLLSVRLAVARHEGLDEATTAKVARYEASDLDERHKVALRVADALMTQPGAISAELAVQARRWFSRDELVELTLDVMKWNYQKVSVALGTDAEVKPGELADLAFDEEGRAITG